MSSLKFSLICLGTVLLSGQANAKDSLAAASADEIVRRPELFAWSVFADISRPNADKSAGWEKWALARNVYADPDLEIDVDDEEVLQEAFEQMAHAADAASRFDEGLIQQRLFERQQGLRRFLDDPQAFLDPHRPEDKRDSGSTSGRFFDPAVRPQTPKGRHENDEVRMNFDSFKYTMQNDLFNIEGQEAMFARRERVDFPIDAKEIKAAWRKLTPEDDPKEFHTHVFKSPDGSDEIWGLIALHITTKDLPNWVWATWEHKSNPQREMVVPSHDASGIETKDGRWIANNADDSTLIEVVKKLNQLPKVWTNYVLRGAQVDFTDSVGNPTILANSIIEEGFQDSSSCITCHARAARGPRKRRSDDGNMLSVFANTDPPQGHIGPPNAEWFQSRTSPAAERFWQMDFVWSTIRAKRKNQPDGAPHPLLGRWIYRALLNDEQRDKRFNDLEMGKGQLEILRVNPDGTFTGRLEIDDTAPPQPLDVSGDFTSGNPSTIRFEGIGSGEKNSDWHYSYRGYLYPDDLRSSQSGTNPPRPELGQIPVISGQVIRSRDHAGSDGVHPAGQLGTWYMLKLSGE